MTHHTVQNCILRRHSNGGNESNRRKRGNSASLLPRRCFFKGFKILCSKLKSIPKIGASKTAVGKIFREFYASWIEKNKRNPGASWKFRRRNGLSRKYVSIILWKRRPIRCNLTSCRRFPCWSTAKRTSWHKTTKSSASFFCIDIGIHSILPKTPIWF